MFASSNFDQQNMSGTLRQEPQDIVQPETHLSYQLSQTNLPGPLRMLRQRVSPLFTSRGILFHVEYINNYRNWADCLPKYATMFGSYRRRSMTDEKIAPHSYTFVRRECNLSNLGCEALSLEFGKWNASSGMPRRLLEQADERLRAPFTASPKDVFCLVKAFVSDSDICQPPLLVFPGCKQEHLNDAMKKIGEGNVPCPGLK